LETRRAQRDRSRAAALAAGDRWRPQPNVLNQSRIVLKQDSTLIAVIKMSLSSWLVAGIVPGVERDWFILYLVEEISLETTLK